MQWALLQISVWRVVVKFTKKGNVNLVFDAKPSVGVSLCYDNILKKKLKAEFYQNLLDRNPDSLVILCFCLKDWLLKN